MGVRELAEKIYLEIQNRQTSTTSILRDARTLGKMLGKKEFEWVENELKGYKSGEDQIPPYRLVDAVESKTWTTHLDTSLQKIYSDFLKESNWTKWILTQSVSELEDLLVTGYIRNTGKVLKSLGFSAGRQTPIYQSITISGQEIKKVLDQIQDKVHEQVGEILSKPNVTVPSTAILLVYMDKFPDMVNDLEIISEFLETGHNHVIAARSCRPALHAFIRASIKTPIPKGYVFTDNVTLKTASEKSKIKYYLEQKGDSIFGDKNKIIFIDDVFRETYDLSSKADKHTVNIYEANLCVDKFLKFLEQLYRYTDLKPINNIDKK